jgi:hypothetical protein
MTALVKAFNAMPVLASLTTAEQVKEFLTEPVKYLDQAILKDTGFTSKVTPSVSGVAQLYGINYAGMIQKIQGARVNPAEIALFSFDETSFVIELMPASETEIRENSKQWIEDVDEVKEWESVKALCDEMNSYFERYQIHPSSMNAIPGHMGLKCQIKTGTKGWELAPALETIKKHLKH